MRAILLSALLCPLVGLSQVGIGTTSVNTSAKLQVDATTQGFLPPRVALASTETASNTIASPATGLLVYNTATAGSGATAVTPGFYYYDGSKWQRIINQQPDATVEFDKPTPTTSGVVFTPNTPASKDYIYVSSVDNSQWTYNGSAYVTYTPPASTPWYLSSGTSDAGSNKTSSIYRSGKVAIGGSTTPNATLDIRTSPTSTSDPGAGFIGVGTTSATAASAGAGAIRYNNSGGGILQYSSGGSDWNTLSSTVQKTIVTGYFSGTNYPAGETTLTCIETSDVDNKFSSNTFTAPRTGLYLITANVMPVSRAWAAGQEFNITFYVGASAVVTSAYFAPLAFTGYSGTNISTVVSLTANQTCSFKSYISGSSGFDLYIERFNRFSIAEL